jgi:hypothetical protein
MVNKKTWLGILVIMLIFGFLLTGCDMEDISSGYTFEFEVEHTSDVQPFVIKQIEFLNGDNLQAPVLQTEMVSISSSHRSEIFKVSGFTKQYANNEEHRVCGVRVTYEDGSSYFGYSHGRNNTKVIVYCWESVINVIGDLTVLKLSLLVIPI